jgi:hypothetical protein
MARAAAVTPRRLDHPDLSIETFILEPDGTGERVEG